MEIVAVERVDHHGIVMGVIKDLGLVEQINLHLGISPDEKITAGEAVAGMIVNGLGFTDRPMTLTPQFFSNCPLEILFRDGVQSDDFNRFKLGRTLDRICAFGCDAWFALLAQSVCKKEGIDTRFCHLDTTSFSLTGEYYADSDEHEILITHGYSKDHRPDLKQTVLELLVSRDGGIPLISKVWDGNTSDNEVFRRRAQALVDSLEASDSPTYVIADSKLYSESNAENLKNLPFITRIPETIKAVSEKILEAQSDDSNWTEHSSDRCYKEYAVDHYGLRQRWIVVHSQPAQNRSEKSIDKAVKKEKLLIDKDIFHLQAKTYGCQSDAKRALEEKTKKWKYHKLDHVGYVEVKKYNKRGRPLPNQVADRLEYQLVIKAIQDEEIISKNKNKMSCYVVGTNIPKDQLSASDVIAGYSEQQCVERGFRFLKDPIFFTSSLFLKNPNRIAAMLTVMTLALLVYGIAERRMRRLLKKSEEDLPNQIDKPTQTPTLRWIFQLLDGISRVKVDVEGRTLFKWTGMTDIRRKILRFFGQIVADIYQIPDPVLM